MDTQIHTLLLGLYQPNQPLPTKAALLKIQRIGVLEEGTLSYGTQYMATHSLRFHPDPDLARPINRLPAARIRDGGALPPYLLDSLPDAWGRLVLTAANAGRSLDDLDMLRMTNTNRVGAVVVMDEEPSRIAEETLSLDDLYRMAMAIQYGDEVPINVRRLLNQGGSLGGARPKTSIHVDEELWLAKFPLHDDLFDYQYAEAGALDLAAQCRIQVGPYRCVQINGGNALLVKRFDRARTATGEVRIHYLSAAGLLNVRYESGEGSYVDLAKAITRFGAAPKEDCQELFRRMIFNMLIDNTDDHVKNHGFLHAGDGKYRLAPVFDIHPQGTNLQYMGMPLTGSNASPTISQILDEAHHFYYSRTEAGMVIAELFFKISSRWKTSFAEVGMSANDIQFLEVRIQPLLESWLGRLAGAIGDAAKAWGAAGIGQ
ncbi:type II toxin-antitoxin system HipA family toxin [Chitinilyticum aquatile]|uniref:type II toxin-antitoxin system HipA family toxin n=1 Tax=Chitinilyticum aquatile TaxID=362520 RepID=UPI00041A897B|nr:HipA domain-containing protein [Chitinilyticum aquatile]